MEGKDGEERVRVYGVWGGDEGGSTLVGQQHQGKDHEGRVVQTDGTR